MFHLYKIFLYFEFKKRRISDPFLNQYNKKSVCALDKLPYKRKKVYTNNKYIYRVCV